jgi:chitinase
MYSAYNTNTPSLNSSIQYFIANGFPKEKLFLGLNSYGRSYLLFKNNANNDNSIIGRKISKQGISGNYTKTTGILAYYEVK